MVCRAAVRVVSRVISHFASAACVKYIGWCTAQQGGDGVIVGEPSQVRVERLKPGLITFGAPAQFDKLVIEGLQLSHRGVERRFRCSCLAVFLLCRGISLAPRMLPSAQAPVGVFASQKPPGLGSGGAGIRGGSDFLVDLGELPARLVTRTARRFSHPLARGPVRPGWL